jgi:3-oxoacyl-[acyl-carrier-protein] synthase-3
MLPVRIAGVGYYLPPRRVSSVDLEQAWSLTPGWVTPVTGVVERRYAAEDETSAGMAAAAARMALDMAQIDVAEVDAIVGASTAPQQAIPCTAVFVQRALRAPEGASACFDVNATCLGFLFALQNAAHLVAAGAYRTVLIFSSEIGSRSLNPQEPQSAVLFGDAAAAVVLRRAAPGETSALVHAAFATYSSGADLTTVRGGGSLNPPNAATTTPDMNLFHMDGPAVFRKASSLVGPFLDTFFARAGCRREEIDCVVPHQASRHGVDLLTARLGFRPEQVYSNLATRGNCIAASIPLALAEAVHEGRIRRGEKVFLVGTGAGLTIGAVSLIY